MTNQETPYSYQQLEKIASFIQMRIGGCHPTIGIISGSGLGVLVEALQDPTVIPYSEIDGFPQSTVKGHSGELVVGKIGDKEVLLMSGRLHMYEGYPAWKVTAPIRMMHLLGVKTLIVTNAAGSLTTAHSVGDIIILKDQIYLPGLCGNNPLIGPNDDKFGPRFLDVSKTFSKTLRDVAKAAGAELGFDKTLKEGVYVMISGPMYETPSEICFLRMIGADVVGMSTCPETIVARHCGMNVLGMTLVTDVAVNDVEAEHSPLTHKEVLNASTRCAGNMKTLIEKIVQRL